MQSNKKHKWRFRQAISLTLLSILICGIAFPLVVTGFAQLFFPNQANGEIVQLNGQAVGSNLIAQNFTLPIFFYPRNDSASGVDPDITIQDAFSQIPRIQNATDIPMAAITQIVNQNTEGIYWIFGSPYVNVLRLNLALVKTYPAIYNGFQQP
jgi:potassium-transporting ATPase KdpC subunit